MDYGNMVGESFEYAKEAVVGKWNKWLMLIIATILLGLPLMGYSMKILRGEKPAPEIEDWGTLFVDGIKYLIVSLIYAIPLIIVWVLIIGASAVAIMSGDSTAMMGAFAAMGIGLLIMLVLGIIIAVFEIIGIVRFARTGSIGEAFNFGAILATIGRIGWVPYLIALVVLIVVGIIFGIIVAIIQIIPILGMIIYLCLIAPWALFIARYVCQIYDSAGIA
ncbi:MAG: DUF4013 domain-containing protein [Methanoregula sp.]|jgi:hypothetical protein|nr:DUF4013 domain-containing protein [Methanoregula sp.]